MFSSAISQMSSAPVLGLRESAPLQQASEYLPFTVRVVHTEDQLQKAVDIRHEAYARHIDPKLADALRKPEPTDTLPGVAILLAESKLDGSPLGTMRIQTNEFRPLGMEKSIELPQWMQGQRLSEATRLGVSQDKVGRLVKTVLFKAYYQYCLANDIRYMVITARAPIDRMYDRMLFQDVYHGMGYVPLEHVFNLPHRIMFLDVQKARTLWDEAHHPLLGYMCETVHPDIQIDA